MATHSNVLAWRIPGTGEPGGLPSMGLHSVGRNWSDLAAAAAAAAVTSYAPDDQFVAIAFYLFPVFILSGFPHHC